MPANDLSVSASSCHVPVFVSHKAPACADSKRLGKVLHVINGEHFSGAERVQQLLGRRLPEQGFEAEFACVKPLKFPELSGLPSDRVHSVPMSGRIDMRVVRSLADLVLSKQFDLLHAHTPRTALVTALVALKTGLPWVYHVHSPTARDSSRSVINEINEMIEKYSVRSCTRLLTVSKSLRREMLRLGVPRERISVVPNGVPNIDPIDPVSRRNEKRWRIGLIALMRPRKGVEIALEAMVAIKQRNLPIELDLIGGFETDMYQQSILEQIAALELESHVHWRGFTTDIPSAIRSLDALMLPSLYGEGMPMVVLEALSAGVPVVATSVEGTPEVVRNGVEGLLAEPRNATSLTQKLIELTASREQWETMSESALKRHRESFSDEQMAKRVAHAYSLILKNNP